MSLVACGTKTKDQAEGKGESNATTEVRIGMVTDTGGVNDQSFNQSAWEGLKRLKETYGVHVSYLESVQEADYATNLDKMVDQDNDLVWGIGFSMAEAIKTAANINMDQLYAIVDHTYGDETMDNVVCVMYRGQESAFLVGYAAGKTTTTNKVGFVGGISSAIIDQFEYGYRAGVAYAAEELGKDIQVSVQYAESFSDAAKGKAIATKMFADGCDIVFHAAGNAGTGVIEAAKDAGKYAIGADRDQYDLAPDNILTSAIKRVDETVLLVSEEAMNGTLEGGAVLEYGLGDNAVGIPTENPNMEASVYEATMEVQQQIIDGAIEVPYNAETLDAFMGR